MVSSSPFVAYPIAVLLIFCTRPVARKVARSENDQTYFKLIMWAVAIHLLFAPIQIWVVDHYYNGITDYNRYIDQGAVIAKGFRSFHYTTPYNFNLVGQGSVSLAAAVVFTVIGTNKLGCFFVFNWLAFLGSVCFFRAYSVTFPEANHKRYAYLIFFLPSILFWTAGVSKETVMYVALGIAAYGAARILAHKRGGVLLLAVGLGVGIYVRPQEFVLFLSVVAMATLFRSRGGKHFGIVRRVFVIGIQVALIMGAVAVTNVMAKHGAAVYNLSQVNQNNCIKTCVPYSSNPADYPRDLYTVLLDPLPIHAHGGGQKVAALENTVLIVLALTSLRRLRHLLRVCLLRPYVLISLVYAAAFCYAFASLGNLGLIDRERVLMLPFLLVLFAIPVTKKGEPPQYEWEMSWRKRRSKRKAERQQQPAWVGAYR